MAPRIRHIAICAEDVPALAAFYRHTFGLKEVARQQSDDGFAIYLTDGYINLAILPSPKAGPPGINHLGFEVEDVREIARLAKEAGAQTGIAPRPRDGRYAEFRLHDPVGTPVDLSEHGWKVEEGAGLAETSAS
ncbi:MAG TPA: VOC family protein [Chloroflexota bacterium]|jgi:catechol 2,3-dioxygenase-like lactoylglutathione lyase family enzyme|nr:VOC family protein [Chloroflexota bacterium]